jgi:hypothetical protein
MTYRLIGHRARFENVAVCFGFFGIAFASQKPEDEPRIPDLWAPLQVAVAREREL